MYDAPASRETFIAMMAAHGIRCERTGKKDPIYRYSSSFTTTYHDAEKQVFYYTGDIDARDFMHETGHLIVWDLLGRPAYNNFGIEDHRGRPGFLRNACFEQFEALCGELPAKLGPKAYITSEELAACAIESAILRRNRKSLRSVFRQLTEQTWIVIGSDYRVARAVVDGMLIIGETYIEAHREKHTKKG
jgi:hypothetical protein